MIQAAFLSHGDFILTRGGSVGMVLRKDVGRGTATVRFDGDKRETVIACTFIDRVTTNMTHVNEWRAVA